jgi:hypothetical protein
MTGLQVFRKNRALLFTGLLVVSAGLWLDAVWFVHKLTLEFYAINLAPGLILLITWYFAAAASSRRWLLIGFGLVIASLFAVYAVLMNFGVMIAVSATTPVVDAARYKDIRADYNQRSLATHFPTDIPPNATQVTFYYLPHFLQGGSHLQLRYRLPQAEVSAILSQYESLAKQIETGAGDVLKAADQQDLPVPQFRNESNTDFAALSNDFLVFVLDAQPYQPADWNHGYSYGLAVSTKRQEVIYWAEYW